MLTYAVAFTATLTEDGESLAEFQDIVRGWLEVEMEDLRAMPKQCSLTERQAAASEGEFWEMRLSHGGDPDGRRTTEIRALRRSTDERVLDVTVATMLDEKQRFVAPPSFDAETPSFVRLLPDKFEIRSIDGLRMPKAPSRIESLDSFETFLHDLLGKHRQLPIVVVTEPGSPTSAVPADLASRLATFLFGLARVVFLSRGMSHKLTEEVGGTLSCLDGGVRLYWPRFSKSDSSTRHPLWIHRWLEDDARASPSAPDGPLRTALMGILSRASVASFRYPDSIRAAVDRLVVADVRSQFGGAGEEKLLSKIAAVEIRLREAKEMEQQALAENAWLTVRVEAAERKARETRIWNERFHATLQQSRVDGSPIIDEPGTIDEALEQARILLGDALELPANILVETSLSPLKVKAALEAMHTLCLRERGGKAADLGAQLRQLLTEAIGHPGRYEGAPTGGYSSRGGNGDECRHRVQIKSAASEIESISWKPTGDVANRRYRILRIGRHA